MKTYWMRMTTGLLLGVVLLAVGCGKKEEERTSPPASQSPPGLEAPTPQAPGAPSEGSPPTPSPGTEQKQPDETKEQKPAEKVK